MHNQPIFPQILSPAPPSPSCTKPGWVTCGVSIHGLCQLRPSHAFLLHIWASIHSCILYCLFCFWRYPRDCNLQENVFDLLSVLKPPHLCVQSLIATTSCDSKCLPTLLTPEHRHALTYLCIPGLCCHSVSNLRMLVKYTINGEPLDTGIQLEIVSYSEQNP